MLQCQGAELGPAGQHGLAAPLPEPLGARFGLGVAGQLPSIDFQSLGEGDRVTGRPLLPLLAQEIRKAMLGGGPNIGLPESLASGGGGFERAFSTWGIL